jgi:enoyl-CoA hydratase/carnithine racemase
MELWTVFALLCFVFGISTAAATYGAIATKRRLTARLAEWQNLAEIACDDADELEEECERLKVRLAFGHTILTLARQTMEAAAGSLQDQREYIDALDIHIANLERQLYGERTEPEEKTPGIDLDGYGIDPAGEPDFTAYVMADVGGDNHKVVG